MAMPVLILGFNRPKHLQRVLDAVLAYGPSALYISLDGPREQHPTDEQQCASVNHLVQALECQFPVHTLVHKTNQGCQRAVLQAIDWFFEQEPMGAILEDDTVPSQSFFAFAQELLQRYQHTSEVVSISGHTIPTEDSKDDAYFFTAFFQCWGWATWADRWQQIRERFGCHDLADVVKALEAMAINRPHFIRGMGDFYLSTHQHVSQTWQHALSLTDTHTVANSGQDVRSKVDSWAGPFMFTSIIEGHIRKEKRLHIVPRANLIENIGFDSLATHTDENSHLFRQDIQPLQFPLKHPTDIKQGVDTDIYLCNRDFCTNGWHQLKRNLNNFYPKIPKKFRQIKKKLLHVSS